MSQILIDANQVADFIARKVDAIAVPSPRLRADVGAVQVDKVLLREPVGEQPSLRLSFETADAFGVELMVKLREFATDPNAYMADLMENLQGIRHAGRLRRNNRQAEIAAVYEELANG